MVWDNLHAGGQLQIVKDQFVTVLFNINSVLLRRLQKEALRLYSKLYNHPQNIT